MGTDSHNPRRVFLVRGTGSCGTSWITALLNLHPRIYTCGEWCFAPIEDGLARWEAQDWTWAASRRMRQIMRRHIADAVTDCLNTAADADKPDAEWVGDCSPDPVSAPDRPLVPGAPVICLVRDGRDVLVSMTCRYLREDSQKLLAVAPGMTAVRDAYQTDPESAVAAPGALLPDEAWVRNRARHWADRVLADLEALEALREAGTPTLLLRYEELHTHTESARDACYRLLGLDPTEAAPLSADSRTTPGFDRPEDLGSFYRAGRTGDWQRHFTADTTRWFTEEAAEALALLDSRTETQTISETKPATPVAS